MVSQMHSCCELRWLCSMSASSTTIINGIRSNAPLAVSILPTISPTSSAYATTTLSTHPCACNLNTIALIASASPRRLAA